MSSVLSSTRGLPETPPDRRHELFPTGEALTVVGGGIDDLALQDDSPAVEHDPEHQGDHPPVGERVFVPVIVRGHLDGLRPRGEN
ncbi:hypothetical protein ACQPZX_14535 [Actinoplanes sp. CA-142083]|uniref:hypothetical protein n=1 Tax=Actinoplanes sp. CA-142083 TaxID=3239903 RepID=UPI003D8B18A8